MPIQAKLVFDGGSEVYIPSEMGMPRENQVQGTPAERLCELAGRVCYDSLGTGRSSEDYHKHILEVNHTSTLEHFNFTAYFGNVNYLEVATSCMNRKGVYIRRKALNAADVTVNLRSVLEWDRYSTNNNYTIMSDWISKEIKSHGNKWAPNIIKIDFPNYQDFEPACSEPVDQYGEDQSFISMFLSGSRGWSHEMVRHRYAMSQRSTRYVDEIGSEWIEHPLISYFLGDKKYSGTCQQDVMSHIGDTMSMARHCYETCTENLEEFLIEKGIDKFNARKQARGASRGYLGNALETQMIFTAPVSGWIDMMRQRCSPFADAEIRLLFNQVLPELKRSRYGHFFDGMSLVPSSDGIGMVLSESRGA